MNAVTICLDLSNGAHDAAVEVFTAFSGLGTEKGAVRVCAPTGNWVVYIDDVDDDGAVIIAREREGMPPDPRTWSQEWSGGPTTSGRGWSQLSAVGLMAEAGLTCFGCYRHVEEVRTDLLRTGCSYGCLKEQDLRGPGALVWRLKDRTVSVSVEAGEDGVRFILAEHEARIDEEREDKEGALRRALYGLAAKVGGLAVYGV